MTLKVTSICPDHGGMRLKCWAGPHSGSVLKRLTIPGRGVAILGAGSQVGACPLQKHSPLATRL